MRLTFRRKLILAFLVVVIGAVGASLLVVDRRFRDDLARRMDDETDRVQRTYRQAQQVRDTQLVWGCNVIAEQPRFRAILESRDWDVGNLELFASQYHEKSDIDCFCIYDAASKKEVFRSFEGNARDAAGGAPEEPLARQALDLLDARIRRFQAAAGADASARAAATAALRVPSTASGYVYEGGSLYQVVALPVQSRDEELTSSPVGAMIVGVRTKESALEEMRSVLGSQAALALVVDGKVLLQAGGRRLIDPENLAAHVSEAIAEGGRLSLQAPSPHFLVVATLQNVCGERMERAAIAILVQISTARESEAFHASMRLILMAGGGVVLLGLLLALSLSLRWTRPILDLVEGTRRVAKGDYSVEVAVRSRDELGTLTSAFNDMAKGLADRERYRSVLTKVVSKEVATELMTQMRGQGLDYGGVGRVCTALFCDIRGFTPLTERMEPTDVISMLNEHMTAMVRVIERHKGVVNKFVGDAIIGIFGAPVAHADDPLHAVRAGLDMVSEVRRVNAGRVAKGMKEIAIGVGIHTGRMVCGVMGSQERAEYTVLGAAVNLTSRVCGGAKPMQVVVSKATLDLVKDHVEAVPLGEQTYKGFSEPVPVFEVRALREEKNEASPALDARARL